MKLVTVQGASQPHNRLLSPEHRPTAGFTDSEQCQLWRTKRPNAFISLQMEKQYFSCADHYICHQHLPQWEQVPTGMKLHPSQALKEANRSLSAKNAAFPLCYLVMLAHSHGTQHHHYWHKGWKCQERLKRSTARLTSSCAHLQHHRPHQRAPCWQLEQRIWVIPPKP